MSINDLTSMDLAPLLLVFGVAAIIFLIWYNFSHHRAESELVDFIHIKS